MPDETPAEPAIESTTRPDHHGLGVDPPDEKKKRGPLRWLVRTVLAVILLALLLVGLAPMLLSTGPGTALVVSIINSRVDGEVTIDDLSLRWGKGQRISGLTFKQPGKGVERLDRFSRSARREPV